VLHTEEKHAEHIYRSNMKNLNEECKFSRIFSSCREIFWFRSEGHRIKRILSCTVVGGQLEKMSLLLGVCLRSTKNIERGSLVW
jgi:hypothetical protein